jgi:hypothetical protein
LARAVQALAARLTPEQARAALDPVLAALRDATHPAASLAWAVQALAARLTPEQARSALDPVLAAPLRGVTHPDMLEALARAVQVLALNLTSDTDKLRRLAYSGLGAAHNSAEATAWADILAMLLPQPARDYIGALVEALKYPTAALREKDASEAEPMSATAYLLGKLRERFPEAQELHKGSLEDALAWVAKSYPEIDLKRPPERPPSLPEAIAALGLS